MEEHAEKKLLLSDAVTEIAAPSGIQGLRGERRGQDPSFGADLKQLRRTVIFQSNKNSKKRLKQNDS